MSATATDYAYTYLMGKLFFWCGTDRTDLLHDVLHMHMHD
jgi:hypothetical protein